MDPATLMGIGSALSGVADVAGLFGGRSGSAMRAQENMHAQNIAFQKMFAQEGIRWRVEDAKKAGIHPLYALGASIPSFSPSTYIPGESQETGGASAIGALGRASQNFARAIDATRTSDERVAERLQALSVERGELENDLLRSRIALLEQQRNPPMPSLGGSQIIPGQADVERLGLTVTGPSSHVEIKPQEVTPPSPTRSFQEPSPVVDLGFAWTGTGYAPVPSKDVKDRMEDITVPQLMWGWRNNVLPNIGQGKPPPAHLIPDGFNNWRWSFSKQEWQPYYDPHRARVRVRRNLHGHSGPDQP